MATQSARFLRQAAHFLPFARRNSGARLLRAGRLASTSVAWSSSAACREQVDPPPLHTSGMAPGGNDAMIGVFDDDPEFSDFTEQNLEELRQLAAQQPTPLRLADMYKYGSSGDLEQRLRNAQFLHKELPVRIAQRAVDLLTLPHGLCEAAPVRQVASVYWKYLERLKQFPLPRTRVEEENFTDMLQSFVLDRASIPASIAEGVSVWNDDRQTDLGKERLQEMEDALYRFFTARVGLRFLTEHHVLSSTRDSARSLRYSTYMFALDDDDDFLGCIQTHCDLIRETTRVAELVTLQTKDFYGRCPEIEIINCIQEAETKFTYVPHHLHYMLAELLKNACRATLQHKLHNARRVGDSSTGDELPSVRAVIVKGEEDVTIKIADKGGGIPRSLMSKIWKFGHSVAAQAESEVEFGTDVSGARIRGFGLPLARVYARYFGGELSLKSMEGYGVDAYLHLPRLGDAGENLPLRVRASPGELDSMPSKHVRDFDNL